MAEILRETTLAMGAIQKKSEMIADNENQGL